MSRLLAATLILAASGSLAACQARANTDEDKTRILAECELDANKTFPVSDPFGSGGHIRTCMRSRGFDFERVDKAGKLCSGGIISAYRDPACYFPAK